jgi:hypothetical protein
MARAVLWMILLSVFCLVELARLELATPSLQNTPRLSVGIAHLGLHSQRVRQDRSAAVPVVVNLGGQQARVWPLRPEAN